MLQFQEREKTQNLSIRDLPKRPQRSTNINNFAQTINLVSNHFKVTFIDNQEKINVYTLQIEPEIASDARPLKDAIMRAGRTLIEQSGLKPYNVRGMNIWSPVKINEAITVSVDLEQANQNYVIRIVFVNQYCYENFSGNMNDFKQRNPLVQATNIGIKDSLRKLKLVEIGRDSKYYDPKAINDNYISGAGMKVWRGFKTALHIFNSQPYLLIDVSSRVLREQTALNFLDQTYDKFKNQRDVIAEMKGLPIIASYGNYRIYRIDDIDFQLTPKSKFLQGDKEVTYEQYFKERYNIRIQDSGQPLIVYIDKRNDNKIVHLIPELMNMTGLTDKQRSDWRLMKDVAQFTKISPEERNQDIMSMQRKLTEPLKERNIQLDSDQRITGIQLYPPPIMLGNRRELKNDTGFFILRDAVLNPAHIKDWFMIYFAREQREEDDVYFLVQELQKNASKYGMKIEKPYYVVVRDENPQSWIDVLEYELSKGEKPQMIVSFVSEKCKDRLYPALKKFCLQKHGISHQNILTKFLKSKNPGSIAQKIVQQMNVKLGKPIWSIPRPQELDERVMLIGIDIYHKLVTGNQSCMGLVATQDADFTQYFSRVMIMKKGQEMSLEIAGVIEQAIYAYYDFNGKKYLPETIIIYRDGVGEGQIQTLIDTEMSQIKDAFKRIDENYDPKCSLIMINKKINHRFFSTAGAGSQSSYSRGGGGGVKSSNGLVNPPTGTIVADKVVTQNLDFFLCAQYVTEGTCTPTHFIVLYNTTNWREETFWMLTYYQCFNYLNWSGAVRVPACVQYAHKLAFLVGDTFQNQVHQDLERLLCYL